MGEGVLEVLAGAVRLLEEPFDLLDGGLREAVALGVECGGLLVTNTMSPAKLRKISSELGAAVGADAEGPPKHVKPLCELRRCRLGGGRAHVLRHEPPRVPACHYKPVLA